jgi:hypothetical protein
VRNKFHDLAKRVTLKVSIKARAAKMFAMRIGRLCHKGKEVWKEL